MTEGLKVRLLFHALAWLLCFLLPIVVIVLDGRFPKSVPISLELLYLTALIGCGSASAFAPVGRWHRLGIFVVTIGLFALQFLIIGAIALAVSGLEGIQ
jgi:hypothetical protein